MSNRRVLISMVVAATLLWLLWPERFAINVPLRLLKWGNLPPSTEVLQQRLQLPKGFSIALYARDLPHVRLLRFTPQGDLLATLPHAGRIVLLEYDALNHSQPKSRRVLLTGLNRPHGIDLYADWLYVAETHAIGRIPFDANKGTVSGEYEHIAKLPRGGGHWTRTLRFGPDNQLYVTVGSSCNACEEKDPRRAALLRFPPQGGKEEIFATGLRNTVGFDWQPGTNTLYGTDNGRDFLGDDFPPDELNRIEQGRFYGWPYANGDKVPDPTFGPGHKAIIRNSEAPVHYFAAHSAPLGITFLSNSSHLPSRYQNTALVALHGSWNRTSKQGYEVVALHFHENGDITEQKFITGFEIDEDVIGRPVDIAEGPDGAIYISDDFAGSIYRVRFKIGSAQKGVAFTPPLP